MPDQHGNYTIYCGDKTITFAYHEAPAFAPGLFGDMDRLRIALDKIANYDGGGDEWDEAAAFTACQRIAREALQDSGVRS
jgi:hypothetical protein